MSQTLPSNSSPYRPGIGQIDVLINNARALWWCLPHEITLKGWQNVMDVNLTGTFLCCREAARRMIVRGEGSIISVASVGAHLPSCPNVGQVVPYTTSKAATFHLTRDLAAQMGRAWYPGRCNGSEIDRV